MWCLLLKCCICSRSIHIDVPKRNSRQFVSMPEKHHAVKNEKNNHPKGKVGKPNGGICEIVNMEKAKEKEEDSRKVRDTVKAAKAGIQDTVNESI